MKKSATLVAATALLLTVGCATAPDEGDLNAEKVAEANANLGIDFMRRGKDEQALGKLTRAVRFDSEHVNAQWALGIVYARLREPGRAEEHFRRAMDLSPAPEIRNTYGVFLCQQGRVDEAVENFRQAADNPRYAAPEDALANAGLCLRQAGRLDAAEARFRRALAAAADHPPALTGMAQLSRARGNDMKARAFIERLDDAKGLRGEALLLAARIELALGDRQAASRYLRRYNEANPDKARKLSELETANYE